MEDAVCLKKVQAALAKAGVNERAALLVGVSGGADSIALLHMLKTLHAGPLLAAHVHHGIRQKSADHDLLFVQALLEEWDIPLYVHHADVPALSRESGMSIEETARVVRYDFFEKTRALLSADYIVTAHHKNDQAETVLMHLLRGSGLTGLCGMRVQSGALLRPLLDCTREEIIAYTEREGLAYCTDETNFSAEYARNKIRLLLLPLLEKEYNPSIIKALGNMASLLQQDEDFLNALARQTLKEAKIEEGYCIHALQKLEKPILTRVIRMALQEANALSLVSRAGIERVCDILYKRSGTSIPLKNGFVACVRYNALIIKKQMRHEAPQDFETPFFAPGDIYALGGVFQARLANSLRMDEGAFVAYMDMDKLPKNAVVRTRKNGDRFYPLGAKGTRKLKDYLIDKKIARESRSTPMIVSGNEVLFFPGGTVSENMRVTNETKRIVRIEWIAVTKGRQPE